MAKPKKPATETADSVSLSARQRAAADLLLKHRSADAPAKPGSDHALPWDPMRSKEEVRAALPPLPPSDHPRDAHSASDTLAHSNPIPVSDRRGVFVDSGNAGKSRTNRSGHKP